MSDSNSTPKQRGRAAAERSQDGVQQPGTLMRSVHTPASVTASSLEPSPAEPEVDVTVWRKAEEIEMADVIAHHHHQQQGTSGTSHDGSETALRGSESAHGKSGTAGRADSDLPTDLGSNDTKSPRDDGEGHVDSDDERSHTPRRRENDKGDDMSVVPMPSTPPLHQDVTPPREAASSGQKKKQKTGTAQASSARTAPLDDPRTLARLVAPVSPCRRVKGAPELPAGLRVLYLACSSDRGGDPRSDPLLFVLQLASEVHTAQRRLAAAQRGRELEKARCETLYNAGLERRAKAEAWRAARQQERAAEELAVCTFTPQVSRAAQRIPEKGAAQFMAKCVEWEKERASRLAARYAREDELVAATAEPQINPNSRAIAERLAREGGGGRPALWEPKRHETAPREPQGAPVTSAEEQRQRRRLRQLLQGDSDLHDRAADGEASSSPSSSPTRQRRGDAAAHVARMEQDILRRHEHAEKRAAQQALRSGDGLFAPITGQPFFRPNAMPTLLRDGHRIPYNKLSKHDQAEFRQLLREHGQEHVLSRCLALRDEANKAGERPSLSGDVAAALALAAERKSRHMERLQAQRAAEETFHPRVTARSARMAKDRSGGTHISKRPIPPKYDAEALKRERDAEEKRAKERAAHLHSPARARAERALAEAIVVRNEAWQERRSARLEQLAARHQEDSMAECTFTPHRTLAHHLHSAATAEEGDGGGGLCSSNRGTAQSHAARGHSAVYTKADLERLANAADVRLANEVELLRAQTAHIDPHFLSSVLDGEHCGKRGEESVVRARSPPSGYRDISSSSGYDLPFRVDPPTIGTTQTPQYLLGHLTRLNAPRLRRQPAHEQQHHQEDGRSAEVSTSSRLPGTSPIVVSRSAQPSLSRSPNRRDWQRALLDGGAGAVKGTAATPLSHEGPALSTRLPLDGAGGAAEEEVEGGGDLDALPDPWAALDAQVERILRRYE